MIARVRPFQEHDSTPAWQEQFLKMLPMIHHSAKHAVRHLRPEAQEDALSEIIANAAVACARLVQLGKASLAFPTVLVRYGLAQFRSGRRVGNRLRVSEVLSDYAQRRKGFVVERLDLYDRQAGEWQEAVLEDMRTPVPDQVAFRIDFPEWLKRQSKRNRRIASALALGHTTGEVAQRFRLSPARISQLRRELFRSWQDFHDDSVITAS